MNLIEKYNNLAGQKISREDLRTFHIELFDVLPEEDPAIETIWNRIGAVLETYPESSYFTFKNVSPVENTGLNGLLYGLDQIDDVEEENTGLNKAVKPSDIYDMITNRMKELIKKASGSGYKKKWKARVYGEGYLIPFNFQSKKRYRGVNMFLLTDFEPLKNPYFLTFKQIEKNKGTLKKGSSGHPVIYFTKLYKYEQAEPKLAFSTYDKKKMIAFLNSNRSRINLFKVGFNAESIARQSYLPILKYYNVFNGSDIEGIDFDLDNFKIGYVNQPLPALDENKMPIAEAVIKNYPSPQPKYGFGGDRAYYAPGGDKIQMPYIVDFESAQDYYRTFFHEIGHSTGATKRLARDFSGKFGSKKYAFEELIAEWAAVFLSAEAGIVFHTNMNHAEYLKNWNNALTKAKDDNKFIMRACTEAQKAADFILQYNKDGNPKYLKDLEKKTKSKKKVDPKKNPKGFAVKPKSTTVTAAIKDVLKLRKFKDEVSPRQAAIFYKYYSEKDDRILDNDSTIKEVEITDPKELDALERRTNFHTFYKYEKDKYNTEDNGSLTLYVTAIDLLEAIDNRLESLKNQDNNLALFDGLKSPVRELDHPIIYVDNVSVSTDKPGLTIPEKTNIPVATNNPSETTSKLSTSINPLETTEEKTTYTDKQHTIVPGVSKISSKYKTAAMVANEQKAPAKLFNISGDLQKLLGKIEVKPVHSLLVTLDSEEGGGKTHSFYQWANVFATAGYKTIIWSLEEHKSSNLSKGKAAKYFTEVAYNNIVIESENDGEQPIETYDRLIESIEDFDVALIDSLPKLAELNNRLSVDQDLRKRYNGKLIFLILQRLSDGKPRGGSKASFDGDIILKVDVDRDNFENNYIYNHKNRYNDHSPLSELKYSPFHQKLISETPSALEKKVTDKNSTASSLIYSDF